MRLIICISCLFPNKIAILLLKLFGQKVSWRAKIGISIVYTNSIVIEKNATIGHFNFIKTDSILLKEFSHLNSFNIFKGAFSLNMHKKSKIGKFNKFTCGYFPVTYKKTILFLDEGTGITSNNYFDLTNNITFGKNCQVAGIGSQFWTHGYIHANEGTDRIRIDGDIQIGNNVYIGSRCLLNPGVTVADAINIGGNSVISKNLTVSGMYVNQPLRYIKSDIDIARNKFDKINVDGLVEEVYTKNKNL